MEMNDKEFGSCMYVSGFALIGGIDETKCLAIDREVITTIQMNMTNLPATIQKFPTVDGKGGSGATVVESLTESFVAWDYWTKLGGAYFFVVSCKKYDANIVANVLQKYFTVKQIKCFTLDLN